MVDATGQVDYINTSIGVATATLYMIEASMQIPPGYAMLRPERHPRRGGRCRWSVSGGSRTRCRPTGPCSEGICDLVGVVRGQIADADFAAKARSGHADRHPHLSLVQPGVRRTDGPQPVARLHREPADRPRSRAIVPAPATAAQGGGGRRRARAGCRPR